MTAQFIPENGGESKADRTPFLKFYTDDWIAGTVGFTLEQEGFYLRMLNRMWARKSMLPYDIKWLSTALNCDPRTVRRLTTFLLGEGKLIEFWGYLVNPRMVREINKHLVMSNSARDRAKFDRRSAEDRPKIAANFSETANKSTNEPATENCPEARSQKPVPEGESNRDHHKLASTESVTDGVLAGLNGSAEPMLRDVLGWMHGGTQSSAEQWITNTAHQYGQAVVRDSYVKLKTDLATGFITGNPLRTWVAIAQRMSREPPKSTPGSPPVKSRTMQALERRMAQQESVHA